MPPRYHPVPLPRKGSRKHLTLPEWQRLREAADASSARDSVLLRLVYEFALRASEPGKLVLDHTKALHKGLLWIPRSKGSRNQWHQITPDTAQRLHEWVTVHCYPSREHRKPHYAVFPGGRWCGNRAKGITRQGVAWVVKTLCRDAIIPDEVAHPHAIKHARVQHLFEACDDDGMPLETMLQTVARVTGHAAAVTAFRHYMAETGRGREIADGVLQAALGAASGDEG